MCVFDVFLNQVFARFMRGFNLPVGSKKLQIGRMGRGYDTGITSSWIVAMLVSLSAMYIEYVTNL